MVLLSISIVLALLITIGLPIGVALWFKKKYHLPWRIFSYGALAYFLAQALVSILVTGFVSLVGSGTIVLSDQSLYVVQIVISVLLTAVMGVIIRWLGMKHLNEDLDNLKSAYGIGIGFGGIESIMLVGIPLLATFIPMIRNTNIDPQTTTLEPEVIVQIEELWQVSPIVPLAGALERIAAFVLHITVTILVLQIFKRKSKLWMAAAIGLEVLVNGSIVGLAESGISYGWVTLISMVFMAANIFILLKLGAFAIKDIDEDSAGIILEEQQAIEEQDL
jgi:uncharacterized membrane protein YhfC